MDVETREILLRTGQACEQLAICRRTLWRWASEGRIRPVTQPGKSRNCVRWRQSDVNILKRGIEAKARAETRQQTGG
jgi:predicted site-specific integrase-resolvase